MTQCLGTHTGLALSDLTGATNGSADGGAKPGRGGEQSKGRGRECVLPVKEVFPPPTPLKKMRLCAGAKLRVGGLSPHGPT